MRKFLLFPAQLTRIPSEHILLFLFPQITQYIPHSCLCLPPSIIKSSKIKQTRPYWALEFEPLINHIIYIFCGMWSNFVSGKYYGPDYWSIFGRVMKFINRLGYIKSQLKFILFWGNLKGKISKFCGFKYFLVVNLCTTEQFLL